MILYIYHDTIYRPRAQRDGRTGKPTPTPKSSRRNRRIPVVGMCAGVRADPRWARTRALSLRVTSWYLSIRTGSLSSRAITTCHNYICHNYIVMAYIVMALSSRARRHSVRCINPALTCRAALVGWYHCRRIVTQLATTTTACTHTFQPPAAPAIDTSDATDTTAAPDACM